jgi:WhiB family redox-sensing transcriptional regulator
MNWRLAAACRRADPELFFPIGTAGPAASQVVEARRICLACPVRSDCLDWAIRSGQDHGIWGGTTEEERRILRRLPTHRQQSRPRRPALPVLH